MKMERTLLKAGQPLLTTAITYALGYAKSYANNDEVIVDKSKVT